MASKTIFFLVGERGGWDGPKGTADARGRRTCRDAAVPLGITQAVAALALQPARAAPRRREQPISALPRLGVAGSADAACGCKHRSRDTTFQHCFYGLAAQKRRYGHCLSLTSLI